MTAYGLLEEIRPFARGLLRFDPAEGELLIIEQPALRTAIAAGHGVVKSGHDFIVIGPEGRRTTRTPPDGIDVAAIPTLANEAAEPLLWNRLNELARELRKTDRALYRQADVEGLVRLIGRLRKRTGASLRDELLLGILIPHAVEVWSPMPDELAGRWAYEAEKALFTAYVHLLAPGTFIVPALAAVALIGRGGRPGMLFSAAVAPVLALAPDVSPRVPVVPLPALDVGALLAAADDGWMEVGMTTATQLMHGAENSRHLAVDAASLSSFYYLLYAVDLQYRCAREILDAVLDRRSSSAVEDNHMADARRRRDLCEEMRAVIGASLAAGIPHPRNPQSCPGLWDDWERWLAELRRLPRSRAVAAVDEWLLLLRMPRFCHEIALACIDLDQRPLSATAVPNAVALHERLTTDPAAGVPPLLASVHIRLAHAARYTGDPEGAREWESQVPGPMLAIHLAHRR